MSVIALDGLGPLRAHVSEEGGDQSGALRLTGPPIETIKLDAEIDVTVQPEVSNQNWEATFYTHRVNASVNRGLTSQTVRH